jgi:exopolyphosphatase/pppGpp-phosphohydrolase
MTLGSEADISVLYRKIRGDAPTAGGITVLHIGDDATSFAAGTSTEPSGVLILPIGAVRTGRQFFRHEPPTPDEVEYAINLVEDELEKAAAVLARGSALYTSDPVLRSIALLAGIPDQPSMILGRDAMERLFTRFAALSQGRPASTDVIPVDAEFSAALLIFREIMHHLGFTEITVTA